MPLTDGGSGGATLYGELGPVSQPMATVAGAEHAQSFDLFSSRHNMERWAARLKVIVIIRNPDHMCGLIFFLIFFFSLLPPLTVFFRSRSIFEDMDPIY